jgi:hypothetical protein
MRIKKVIIIISAVLLSTVYIATVVLLNPTWWPKNQIEKYLLNKMPVGTNMNEAVEIVNKKNWRIISMGDFGYGISKQGRPSTANTPAICSKTIRLNLGSSFIPISWAEAYIGFDDDGRLVDITVWKFMTGI